MHDRTEKDRLSGYFLVAAAAALWGTLGIVGRFLYENGLTPSVVVTLRATGAAMVLLLGMSIMRPAWLRIRLVDLPYFAAYGIVSVAAFNLLYFVAVQHIPVAAASVLLYTAPAFVMGVAYVLFGEPITRSKVAALALTLVGCALVARAYEPAVLKIQGVGLLAGLGAGLTYGLYSIFGKYGLKRYNPWVVQTYSMTMGAAALLLFYGKPALHALNGSWSVLLAVAYLCLVPTLLAYGLYLSGLRRIESSQASLIATVEPVVAALLGYVVLREPLHLPQVSGAILVLAGAAALHLGGRRPLPER
jgi:DME family drug/metabolite transporter